MASEEEGGMEGGKVLREVKRRAGREGVRVRSIMDGRKVGVRRRGGGKYNEF